MGTDLRTEHAIFGLPKHPLSTEFMFFFFFFDDELVVVRGRNGCGRRPRGRFIRMHFPVCIIV